MQEYNQEMVFTLMVTRKWITHTKRAHYWQRVLIAACNKEEGKKSHLTIFSVTDFFMGNAVAKRAQVITQDDSTENPMKSHSLKV